jgi:hypothetical protein
MEGKEHISLCHIPSFKSQAGRMYHATGSLGAPFSSKNHIANSSKWMCGFMAIAASATFVVAFFTVHETAYKREIVN